MPFWYIFVSYSWGDIEHNNCTMSTNTKIKFLLVTFTETSQFLLSSCVPNVKFNWAMVCVKNYWIHLNPLSCNIFFFEFTRDVSLHEASFSGTTVAAENEFEHGHSLFWSGHDSESKRVFEGCLCGRVFFVFFSLVFCGELFSFFLDLKKSIFFMIEYNYSVERISFDLFQLANLLFTCWK